MWIESRSRSLYYHAALSHTAIEFISVSYVEPATSPSTRGEVEDNSPFSNPLARSEGLLRCGEDRRKGEEGRGNESDRKGGRKPYPPNKTISGYGELCLLFVLVGRCGDTTAQRLRRTRVSVLVKLRVYDVRFLLERNHSKPPLPRST